MRDGRNPNDASTSDWAFSFEAIIASIIIVIMTIQHLHSYCHSKRRHSDNDGKSCVSPQLPFVAPLSPEP